MNDASPPQKKASSAQNGAAAHVVRLDALPATPWKNGGGATRELARAELPDGSGFAWRLSVADIEQPGPFSDFRGYGRQLVLLDGTGLCLQGPATGSVRLDQPGDMHVFDGADEISATLHGGSCRDVNVMTSHQAACHWEVQLLRGPTRDIAGAFVLFPVRGRWLARAIDRTGDTSVGGGHDGSTHGRGGNHDSQHGRADDHGSERGRIDDHNSGHGRDGDDRAATLIAEPGTALVHLRSGSAFSLGCTGGGLAILLRLHPHPALHHASPSSQGTSDDPPAR